VITAAGVVLAGTFAALTQIPGVSITEVGTAVALGVLLDTLVVRTILVPASLLTIGERVWWPARSRRGRQGADPYQDTGRTQPAMPKGTTAS
jgi:putative drug exporter of the RND superfamily